MRTGDSRNRPRGAASSFGALFVQAYQRIWASKELVALEIFFWCVFAADLGFWTFDFHGAYYDFWKFRAGYWIIVGLTPITTGAFVYLAHVSTGSADESLRSLPLRPIAIIAPRMAAVGVSWLQLFAAPLIGMLIAEHAAFAHTFVDRSELWLRTAFYHLAEFPYDGPFSYSYRAPSSVYQESLSALTSLHRNGILLLAFTHSLGWVTLPITWGFWWGTRLVRRSGYFLLAHMAYLVLPAFLVWSTIRHFKTMRLEGYLPLAHAGSSFYFLAFKGLSGLALSFVFVALACVAWGRRDQ